MKFIQTDKINMNSKVSEESPSSSREDNNANLNNGKNQNQSKGAIPKTKNYLKYSQNGKKNIKMNNNIETISSLNLEASRCSLLKLNGFSNITNNSTVNNTDDSVQKKKVNEFEITDSTLCIAAALQDVHSEVGSTSSEENELSISDDGCIYTYKGDSVADLPSSFYNLELPVLDNDLRHEQREGNSSPEMDFLEMDFDPGPSGDADSESSSSSQLDNCELPLNNKKISQEQEPSSSKDCNISQFPEIRIESIKAVQSLLPSRHEERPLELKPHCKPAQKEIKMPWSCTMSQRTRASKQLRIVRKHMNSFGELSSPKEDITPVSDYTSSTCSDTVSEEENRKVMIWSDREASLKQITQIGPSSCGATAVLNVLIALRLPLPSIDAIQECVQTRLRSNFSPLPEYLKSRSRAGCSHKEIITSLKEASKGKVYARFFSMYPERCVNIYKWLGFWIQQGAIPVATLNLQQCNGPIPDSWHHQMIYGVDNNNVYLTNPVECVNSSALWHQLVSESVLLIRREDILARWDPRTDIIELGKIEDVKWKDLNVLGQVAKIIREKPRESRENSTITSHIKIPANYKSGITLAIDIKSAAYPLLRECPELPILNTNNLAVLF